MYVRVFFIDRFSRGFSRQMRHIQWLVKVFCDYSMLATWYEIGKVYFRLLGTSGFHVKAIERFTAGARVVVRTAGKYENFMSSFCRLRQKIAPKSVSHVQHDYFS